MTSGESSTVAGATSSVVIRGYNSSDRAAIREICREAAREQPNSLFHEDGELAPLLLVDYYLEYEPESCFVAEANRRVVGYIVGCKNTKNYLKGLRRRIFPRVLLRIMWKLVTTQYRRRATYRALWWKVVANLGTRQADRPTPPAGDYPAHSHFNVERGYREKGIGYALSAALHDHLRMRGIKGMHAVIVEKAGENSVSRYLCSKRGHKVVAINRHAFLQKLTGEEYYLKLLVCDLEEEARSAPSAKSRGESSG